MESKYAGMTVNERLYVSGLIDEAVKSKSTEKIRAILEKVDLKEESIKPILESLELSD